jgi:hypothetical protein
MKRSIAPPWARGPLELLRHADGHLTLGGDIDRRIALIGFDQTIETSIEVYVRLHPRLRAGREIAGEEAQRALRSFHSKIEFLEKHLDREGRTLDVSLEAIVWYHSLRNELYHSGNGMVPELHVVQGARTAAIRVFAELFGDEFTGEFGAGDPAQAAAPDAAVTEAGDVGMQFLSRFIVFEKLLRERVRDGRSQDSIVELWKRFLQANPDIDTRGEGVHHLVEFRNRIVHGIQWEDASQDENLAKANSLLWRLTDALRGREG